MWFNKIRRDVTDDAGNSVKLFQDGDNLYFDKVKDFSDYVKHKRGEVVFDMHLEPESNARTQEWTVRPNLYAIEFPRALSTDMSVVNFLKLSYEEQAAFMESSIDECLANNNIGRDNAKITSFFFKNQYFEFPTVSFKNDFETHLANKTFEPRIWLGKRVRYDESSNSRESINIIASEQIVDFLNTVKRIIESRMDEFAAAMNTSAAPVGKKKGAASKKVEISGVKLPLRAHVSVPGAVPGAAGDDDASQKETIVNILNVKQPFESEDSGNTMWASIPSGLSYNLKYPKISISKLWFDDKSKELVLQMSLSRYTQIDQGQQGHRYSYTE